MKHRRTNRSGIGVDPASNAASDLSDLVVAAQRGDEEAFSTLFRVLQPGLLRYLRVLVGDAAEDVAAETWLHIARDLRSFRRIDGFRAWATTIARNRAMDLHRYRRVHAAALVPIEHVGELAGDQDTYERAAESISTDAAISLIATLPPDQAEAVLLRVVIGLDAEAAAKVLGKRPGAVRTAAHRGLRRLAGSLSNSTGADPARPPRARGVTEPGPTTPVGTR